MSAVIVCAHINALEAQRNGISNDIDVAVVRIERRHGTFDDEMRPDLRQARCFSPLRGVQKKYISSSSSSSIPVTGKLILWDAAKTSAAIDVRKGWEQGIFGV